MLTEYSKLVLSVMLEVLIHFSWKNLCICHVAPGESEADFVLLQREVCLTPPPPDGPGDTRREQSLCWVDIGSLLMGLPFWTVSVVFVIHHLPDSISFTCMMVTQENGTCEQCCCAFQLLSWMTPSIIIQCWGKRPLIECFKKKKRKKPFSCYWAQVCFLPGGFVVD